MAVITPGPFAAFICTETRPNSRYLLLINVGDGFSLIIFTATPLLWWTKSSLSWAELVCESSDQKSVKSEFHPALLKSNIVWLINAGSGGHADSISDHTMI